MRRKGAWRILGSNPPPKTHSLYVGSGEINVVKKLTPAFEQNTQIITFVFGGPMGRQRQRACLEQGLSLDINFLARSEIIEFGNVSFNRSIRWGVPPDYAAAGTISAELIGHSGWLQVQIGENTQRIEVVSEARHFGGSQRYFICPTTGRKAAVLWQPRGAHEFRSRQGWGNSVAYITQIGSWVDRAHRGKEKIKNILIGDEDPELWDLPPKPKWMRLKTYENYVRRFDLYEAALAQGPDGKSMMSRPK